MVMDLTWLIQRRLLAWMTGPVRTFVAHRTGLGMNLRTSIGKARLQLERFRSVCRECLPKGVDLLMHFWHGPCRGAGF